MLDKQNLQTYQVEKNFIIPETISSSGVTPAYPKRSSVIVLLDAYGTLSAKRGVPLRWGMAYQ